MDLSNMAVPYIFALCTLVFISLAIGLRAHASFYLALEAKELQKNLYRLKIQLNLMIISSLILFISSFALAKISEDPIYSTLASTLSSLQFFAFCNQIYIYYLFEKAHKDAQTSETLAQANEKLALILYYFTPLNIIICALGVLLEMILESII